MIEIRMTSEGVMRKLLLAFTILLLTAGLTAAADMVRFGDWFVGYSPDGTKRIFASTVNEAGNVLGQYCFLEEQNCAYVLGLHIACEKGALAPVLANSDVGAFVYQVQCQGPGANGLYEYTFTKFDDINDLMNKGMRAGFAFPMQGDNFRVVRFSLNGSDKAIEAMRKVAAGYVSNGPQKPSGHRAAEEEL